VAEELGERTEQPTARKRQQARDRGQVAKSQDVGSVAILFASTVLLAALGAGLVASMTDIMRRGLESGTTLDSLSLDSMLLALRHLAAEMGIILVPFMVIIFLVAAVAQFVQVGPLWTTKPLEPKLDRLSPIAGFKRVFGKRGLVRTGTGILKLVVVLTVATLVIFLRLPTLAALPELTMAGALLVVMQLSFELALILIALLLVIAVIDLLFQRWQQTQDLKMTKQEVKDERKSMEGDPQVKGQRMRMYQEMLKQQVNTSVPQADVVITNPTHFSVAIRYDQATMAAPIVVAKGVDELAMRIRHIATIHKVPLVARPPLARALYWGVNVGEPVRAEHYEAVAEILAYVYRLDAKAGVTRSARRETAAV
jgi:flagellar biosynthetic protein FlhB